MSVALVPMMMKAATMIATHAPAIQSALAVGTAATGYMSARGQAQAMEEANAQANEQARQYLIEDYDQVGKMALQERQAAAQRQQENSISGQKARASVSAAAGEAGVSGLSIDALLGDLYGQEAGIRDGINQNLSGTLDQLGMEGRGLQRNVRNQMASRQVPNRPSLVGSVYEGASGVFAAQKHKFKIGD